MSRGARNREDATSGAAISFFNRARRLMRDLLGENERLRAENRRLRSAHAIPADGGEADDGRRLGGGAARAGRSAAERRR